MSEGQRCVECKQWIAKGRSKCSCGGKIPTMDMCVVTDRGCQYQSKSRCCPLPGSINPSTHNGGRWYCGGHYHSLGDPGKGEEWLDYVDKHYDEIMEIRRDW
jgi:hypothetical protein